MAQTFKDNFVVDAQRLYRNAYCERTFSTWDFAITGKGLMKNKYNAYSSQLKVRQYHCNFHATYFGGLIRCEQSRKFRLNFHFAKQELNESTEVKKKKDAQKGISKVDVLSWILAIFCWTVFLVATGLISWGAIYLLDNIINPEEESADNFDTLMEVSLILTFMLWFLPIIFGMFLRDVREYDVRTKNYVELSRTFILAFVLLAVVIIKHIITASTNMKNDEYEKEICWENQVGEQMYQLLILFFIILVILPFLLETIQGIICRGYID